MTISMFQDKIYEEMDDISKLVEPIESTINNELSKFPDEIEITKEHITSLYHSKWGWGSLALSSFINSQADRLGLNTFKGENVSQFFKFEVKDLEEGDNATINFKTGFMSHKVFLIKHTIGFDDKQLEKMAKKKLTEEIREKLWSNKHVNKPRLNEIADLFGADNVKSDRSFKGKVNGLCSHINRLVDDKKLDIRDLELCTKFSNWLVLYVRDGNLAALNNITRIKIMMHENRPIYSIKERDV